MGQSVLLFAKMSDYSNLYCFEPVTETFLRLVENTKNDDRVICHQVALGAKTETVLVTAKGRSTENRIVSKTTDTSREVESVSAVAGDDFCRDQGIQQVSFVKIDTEGHDLNVLSGFVGLLKAQRIDLIQVEAGMNHLNRRHIPLQSFVSFLAPLGYVLFGLYDQVHERHGRPFLRRANAVFVAMRAVDENTPL